MLDSKVTLSSKSRN